MQLFGSDTSPFARRLRMWIAQQTLPVDYQHLDIFSPEGRTTLQKYSSTGKIPFLLDANQCIYDSSVIFDYLSQRFNLPALSWNERNVLTCINAANDSAVELVLSKRSGFDIQSDALFFNLQRKRIHACLTTLENQQANQEITHPYLQISLFCLLDWLEFRELNDISAYKALNALKNEVKLTPYARDTDPRG